MKDSFISFVNYHFSYFMREHPALSDIDLSISKGEFVVVTGASGSGKSTLAYSILGLVPFFYSGESEGEVLYRGKDISKINLAEHSKNIGYISQRINNSFATPYVFSELAFPLEYAENNRNKDIGTEIVTHSSNLKINNLLSRKVHNLSEGEKQLVSFGCASINNVDVIIADEPLANLDYKNRELILTKLREFHDSGKTLIVTSHDYELYLPIASRVIHIAKGRLREDRHLQKEDNKHIKIDYENKLSILEKPQKTPKAPTSKDIAIEVRDLNFKYSEQFQLNDVSFSIEKGKVIGIIGDNGSGKTTLLKILCGLIKPQSGTINICGKSIKNLQWNDITENIGIIFQDPDKQFFESTVKDEILLISKNLERNVETEKISSELKECGLEGFDAYNPHSLSFGEKRRLAFLASIKHHPEIVMIDEITVGMDNQNKSWLLKKLIELRKLEKTLIIVSHDWKWLGKIADSVIYLKDGKISSLIDGDSFNRIIQEKSRKKNSIKEEGK
ncbi:MAG: ABC transporter ATP-binding protein [Candidatus Heimdallarchaeaceae archaeon]